ncbi:GIY-YIG nuclease family protein, partial [Pontimonas sp.]|nr:GIY-YIG nuclease family protein [Pontimonas sp.]
MVENDPANAILDPYGLLDPVSENRPKRAAISLVDVKISEIARFRELTGSLPRCDSKNPLEARLAKRLSVAQDDSRFTRPLETLGLPISSSDAHYSSAGANDSRNFEIDPFGLLSYRKGDHLAQLRHVRPSERIQPDYYSSRRTCKDFHLYEEKFVEVVSDLNSGARELIEFSADSLGVGSFAVLSGVLLLVDDASLEADIKTYPSGKRERVDGRTRTIFANGTESTILFRSLVRALQKDGLLVSEMNNAHRVNTPEAMSPDDTDTGFVYIVKSSREDLKQREDLFKIGFTAGPLEQRLKNAESEPAYLYASVELVATYRCINLSSRHLESLLHKVFAECKIEIVATDGNGKSHKPQEWFEVPFSQIDKAVERTISGDI